jgi:hypothetical protein
LWCKCASSLKLEVFWGFTLIFEGQYPYWWHLKALCLFLLIFISILWTLFNWKNSTIYSIRSKCLGFTHWDSLQWHPFHLTRYCLHVCLVCLTPRYIQPHLQACVLWNHIWGGRFACYHWVFHLVEWNMYLNNFGF